MLKNDLYKVAEHHSEAESTHTFELDINPLHKIFEGHFPGQPVLPGVCQIEMVKELLSEVEGRSLRLMSSGNIKYIEIVDPTANPKIKMHLSLNHQPEGIRVSATSSFPDGRANFKFSGIFN